MFFINIFGEGRSTKRSRNFPSYLEGKYKEMQPLLLKEEFVTKDDRGFGSGNCHLKLAFSDLYSFHKSGNRFGLVIPINHFNVTFLGL